MVKIRDIKDNPCKLFYIMNDRKEMYLEVGNIKNILQWNDIRIQMKQEDPEKYFIMFNGKRYDFNKNAQISNYPDDLLDTIDKQLSLLCGF